MSSSSFYLTKHSSGLLLSLELDVDYQSKCDLLLANACRPLLDMIVETYYSSHNYPWAHCPWSTIPLPLYGTPSTMVQHDTANQCRANSSHSTGRFASVRKKCEDLQTYAKSVKISKHTYKKCEYLQTCAKHTNQ